MRYLSSNWEESEILVHEIRGLAPGFLSLAYPTAGAGTLCDEVSHTIHHDALTLMEKRKKIAEREVGAANSRKANKVAHVRVLPAPA